MNSTRPVIRHAFLSILLVLLFLLLNRPEVVFFSRVGFVAWYPAIGVLMALALGVSPWYALLACLSLPLSGKIIYGEPLMSFGNTVDAAGVALCYGGAAYVLRGPLQIDLGLRRRQDVVRYICVSAVAVAGATTIGVACLIADHGVAHREYNAATVAWFLGDAIGLVGIAPFLLIHVFPYVRNWLYSAPSPLPSDKGPSKTTKWSVGALVEACAQALAIFGVCWAMFGFNDGRYGFYTCFIPVIWIAMRQGIRRVVTALLAVNCGIVVAMHFSPPTGDVLAKVGPFMLVLSAVGLIVGSEVSERHRLAIRLNQQTTYLQSLIQSSPFGIVVLDRQGQVEVVNPAFQRLLLNVGKDLDCVDMPRMLSSASSLEDSGELMQDVFEGQRLQKTTRQQRTDGTFLDLAVHAVPLIIDNEVRGAYMIYQDISEQIRASETARSHSESLSKLVTQLQLRARELTLLNEMKDLLDCCTNPAEASKVVAESVQKLIPRTCSGSLYVFQSFTDLAAATVHWGSARASEVVLTFDSCWCLRRGQPHWSELSGSGLKCTHLMVDSTGSSLCVPMTAQGQTLGVLHLEFAPDMESAAPQSDTTEDWRVSLQLLATSVAGQTATALSSLNLRQKLLEQSTRDPLTELFNRRFMDESLEREMLRATRNSRPLSVMLIDIDHFKRFNDTFGHDAGDHVLQSLADLLRTFFRAHDICCRYGGEEFAIILSDSSSLNAVVRANALRTEVKRLNLSHGGQSLGPITISIGLSSFPEDGSCAEALLKSADRCLYESKARGRDVVTAPASTNVPSVQLQTSPAIS